MKVKLALAGGGALMYQHAGMVWGMDEFGLGISKIAGVSAGAYIAGYIASGGKAGKELNKLMLSLTPIKDKIFDPTFIPTKLGVLKGDKITKVMRKHVVPRFSDVVIPLKVFTANVGGQRLSEWSDELTPNADLAEMIVCSGRIPYVFKALRIKEENHVDAGIIYNLPIDCWNKNDNIPDDVLGVMFESSISGRLDPPKGALFRRLISHSLRMFTLMQEQAVREAISDMGGKAKILSLKIPKELEGIGTMSFGLNKVEAKHLIEDAKAQTLSFLEKEYG